MLTRVCGLTRVDPGLRADASHPMLTRVCGLTRVEPVLTRGLTRVGSCTNLGLRADAGRNVLTRMRGITRTLVCQCGGWTVKCARIDIATTNI